MTAIPQKEQIRQAALRVFNEKGYDAATIAEIAALAGVNPAIIYRSFTGKRDLFDSLERPDLDFPDPQEQQRRAEIMNAGLRVFSRKGYAAATMEDISNEVGLSKAGVYFYYPSKEALFDAVVEVPAGFAVIHTALEAALSDPQADFEQGLAHLARAYLSLFEREEFRAFLQVILSEGVRNPAIAAGFREKIVRRGTQNVLEYMQKHCALPPDQLALKVQSFFGMLLSWGVLNILLAPQGEEGHPDLDRVAREMAHQFLYGIRDSLR